MVCELQKSVHINEAENLFCETPGFNNPEICVLRHKSFYTYIVLVFADLNQAQMYKMHQRDSPHHGIE